MRTWDLLLEGLLDGQPVTWAAVLNFPPGCGLFIFFLPWEHEAAANGFCREGIMFPRMDGQAPDEKPLPEARVGRSAM